MGKTVPLSVRISEIDAAFLASAKLAGAVTPSEKIRELITQARQREQTAGNPVEAAAFIRALLEPQRERIRAMEHEAGVHSDLVSLVVEWLPEFCAHFLGAPLSNPSQAPQILEDFERALIGRLTALMESVLRLAVTRRSPCYDPEAVSASLSGTLELAELILQAKRNS